MPPPTLADIQLPPRRPLRDGSVSTTASVPSSNSSRGRLPKLRARRQVTPLEFDPDIEINNDSLNPELNDDATNPESPPRFTAQEKGKGRAVEPDPIEVSSDEMSSIDDVVEIESVPNPERLEQVENKSISSFTCPVCFCAPPQPALTPCGHVMCRTCLHSSLLASIKRLPNPYPLPPRGRGRRGRVLRGRAPRRLPQPKEWTDDSLRSAYAAYLDKKFTAVLEEHGVEKENWEAMIQAERETREVKVEQVLKGLWKLGDDEWVVEGECPVCRKKIPGGFGPTGSGIGGVKLLEGRIGMM